MENTNCGCDCAFVKAGFIKSDKECPNFVQSLWQQEGNPTPKIVSDCFPKKFALEQNAMLHRFICMQSVVEGLRHEVNDLKSAINQLCQIFSQKLTEKKDTNLILSDKENLKTIE